MNADNVAAQVQRLTLRRAELAQELVQIDETLNAIAGMLGGNVAERIESPAPQRRTRTKRSGQKGLADTMEHIMRRFGKPIRIADLTATVEHSGYQTRSKNVRAVISQALIKDKRFKNVERGVWALAT